MRQGILKYIFFFLIFSPPVFSQTLQAIDVNSEFKRTTPFPTQLIRLKYDMSSTHLDYQTIWEKYGELINNELSGSKVVGGSGGSCYPFEGKEYCVLDSYFDPYSDEAITKLRSFIDKYQDSDFMGVPLTIEPVRGVLVNLKLRSLYKQKKIITIFTLKNSIYFDNQYDFLKSLVYDFNNLLSTNDPELITYFLKKWIKEEDLAFGLATFLKSLKKSNQVSLDIRSTFLLEKEPRTHQMSVTNILDYDCRRTGRKTCL